MSAPAVIGFKQRVVVGIADLAVSNHPNTVLTTYSLGACLGVAIYDPVVKVGGLLHSMLPDSTIDPTKAAATPALFVDTGMPAMFQAATKLNADKRRLLIYVAGGAQVLDDIGFYNLGQRNYGALVRWLLKEDLRIQAERVGGMINRTLSLNLQTGELTLKNSGQTKDVALC